MTEKGMKGEIRSALDRYHAAQKAGDLDAIMQMFVHEPQHVINGVPAGPEAMRRDVEAHIGRNAYASVTVDLSRLRISVDTTSDYASTHGANATAEPVIYNSDDGQRAMAYDMIRSEENAWQFVHQQVLPDPDTRAYSDQLLAHAGTPLDKQTMVWTRRLDVPLEEVWHAVSTEEGLKKWWLPKERDGGGLQFALDLRKGGAFRHSWESTILDVREHALIDLKEFRIELQRDGDGTLLTFFVFTMNGDEWRAFWRVPYTPLYYAQFGGFDPWTARGWHDALDLLETSLTGREFDHTLGPEWEGRPGQLIHFYLTYLRELHRQKALSSRPALKFAGPGGRSDEAINPEVLKNQAYEGLQLRLETRTPQSVLVIERETSAEGHPAAAAEMLNLVADYISEQGEDPSGRPFMRILELTPASNPRENRIRFEAGFPASPTVAARSEIQRRELPGGTVVSAVQKDPIDSSIRGFNAWPRIIQYAEEQGATLDSVWGGAGGWQEFVEIPPVYGKGDESKLYLPISR
ncbi:hypothetical protein CMK11_22240 [Candidatus Poribacteria bacterium]|nr:hypothetical protein [Candidatus Poribacteria bacterium]